MMTDTKTQKPEGREIDAMQKRLRELTFLQQTSQVLTATLDLDSVLRSLMAQVRDYFRVEAASVALLDEETGELVFRVAVGGAADEMIGLRLAPGQGIAGWVAQTGEPSLVATARSDERFYSGIDKNTGFHTRTILAVPIKVEGHTIGVIEAINPAAGLFDEDAQHLFPAVADLAAAAIRNAELYERVRQAERRYESLFNESTDPIIVLDMEGKILDLNQQAIEMFKISRDQLIGTTPYDLFRIPNEAYQTALQQLEAGQQLSREVEIQSGDESRTMDMHMAKIDYGGRAALQWVGHDISEQVALERIRDDLTHMIIHDLRNPLSSIMSSLQLIHTAFVEQDNTLPITKLLRIAMRSGQKLYLLIDSLLDLGRLESGETELNKTFVRPETLLREAIEQIQPVALNRKQTLKMRAASDLPRLPADRNLILRVLTNLLDNAVKFTRMEGHITLSVERTGEEMLFTVSDTGPGIPAELGQRIFDRFTRLENAENIKGTGLGLAFCKLAVEAHGGRIWVESKMGHGSSFRFTLPLKDR
ncbi:MAG: GAF domain-containing protein [Chloroflexi bacterium]|nr:GAF domain-containing protein [Chloroflexota bacterium]